MTASTFTVYDGTTLLGYALFDRGEVKLLPNKLTADKAATLLEALYQDCLPTQTDQTGQASAKGGCLAKRRTETVVDPKKLSANNKAPGAHWLQF